MSSQFKIFRVKTGMNQEEAAKKLDVHPTTLNKYESGARYPSGKVLKKMSVAYKVPIESLIDAGEGDISTTKAQERREEEMYRIKFEEAQQEIISLLKKNAELEKRLSGLGVSEKKARVKRKVNGE
tara:strand:- start:559 stop:936 length:378 start_codon:yes stop_codon:yes gene_type:complete